MRQPVPDDPAPEGGLARLLAAQPEAMRALMLLEATLNSPSALPSSLKELVLTRVAALNGCRACIRLHLNRARREGLTPELAAAAVGDAPAPSAGLRAALALAETLTTGEGALPDTVAEVRRHYRAEQVHELVLLIAAANMFNRLMACARL
jgi:AhpD family alkylhydroperoxidase